MEILCLHCAVYGSHLVLLSVSGRPDSAIKSLCGSSFFQILNARTSNL